MLQTTIRKFLLGLPLIFAIGTTPANTAQSDELHIYIDADFSIAPMVGEAIELGLRAALADTEGQIAGLPVSIRRLDHRTNPRRSHKNFETFLRDPHAIAMVGGQQSPPYLSYGTEINASRVPLLLAWSAAAPLTRFAEGDQNHIFRLSVDDSKAGAFLVAQALADGCRDIALLLADTGWGRANQININAALGAHQLSPVTTITVPSDVGRATARNVARDLQNSGAECSLAVLTNVTSSTIFAAMHEMQVDVDVFSHWGIFSPDFTRNVPHDVRQALNLRVLHTCALSLERSGSQVLDNALHKARAIDNRIAVLGDIRAPAGFVNGYDLGRIFQAAIEQAATSPAWDQSPVARRDAFRAALVSLEEPVEGIMKTYAPPFSRVSAANADGHEALGQDSLCLAKFDRENRLVAAELR
ncbi:MAG: ABC transporter substrate-binding protein [Pseudomonadota bacterium]